jgi:hypothetical protein
VRNLNFLIPRSGWICRSQFFAFPHPQVPPLLQSEVDQTHRRNSSPATFVLPNPFADDGSSLWHTPQPEGVGIIYASSSRATEVVLPSLDVHFRSCWCSMPTISIFRDALSSLSCSVPQQKLSIERIDRAMQAPLKPTIRTFLTRGFPPANDAKISPKLFRFRLCYFTSSVGGAPLEVLKRYIQEQEKPLMQGRGFQPKFPISSASITWCPRSASSRGWLTKPAGAGVYQVCRTGTRSNSARFTVVTRTPLPDQTADRSGDASEPGGVATTGKPGQMPLSLTPRWAENDAIIC